MTHLDGVAPTPLIAEPGTPLWAVHEPSVRRRPLSGEHRCRTAIIGAGLAGLSTALHLTEHAPGDDIAVLDTDLVGSGASGRGTGLVGPRVGPALSTARKRYGDASAAALFEWSQQAVAHVLALCARHHINCDLATGTQLIAARDEHEMNTLREQYDAARAIGADITAVAGEELPTPPGRYLGALRYSPAATLNPAAFTRQVAATIERSGVSIFEKSPVRRITRRDGGLRLDTDRGTVLADRVVVAINGAGTGTRLRAGVVGMRVQAAATEQLSVSQLAEIRWLRNEPIIESGELAPYYRLTGDGRLIVGGGCVRRTGISDPTPLDPLYLQAVARLLHPCLDRIRLAYTWSGPVGMTLDALPVIGARRANIFTVAGWCGHGIAASVYAGARLAHHLLETGCRTTDHVFPVARGSARGVPGLPPVLRAVDTYLAHLNKTESRSLGNRVFQNYSDSKAQSAAVTASTTEGARQS